VYSNYNGTNCANGYSSSEQFEGATLLAYQCTELIQRWAYNFAGINPSAWGANDAYTYWNQNIPGTQDITNGTGAPQAGDILVFGSSSQDPTGHVGIVVGVGNGELWFVGQNQGWAVSGVQFNSATNLATPSSLFLSSTPILGWIRLTPSTASSAPTTGSSMPYGAQQLSFYDGPGSVYSIYVSGPMLVCDASPNCSAGYNVADESVCLQTPDHWNELGGTWWASAKTYGVTYVRAYYSSNCTGKIVSYTANPMWISPDGQNAGSGNWRCLEDTSPWEDWDCPSGT
jgi:hypothetical protein